MAKVVGLTGVEKRLHAIGSESGVIKRVAAFTIGQMRRNIPRKTSMTSRSLQSRIISETRAEIIGSPVAVYLDTGTGLYGPLHHRITPKAARALAFHVGSAASLRLSGKPRVGAAGLGAQLVVVRSIAGMKARPYIARSVQEASQKVGTEINAELVTRWNGAA